MYIIFIFL